MTGNGNKEKTVRIHDLSQLARVWKESEQLDLPNPEAIAPGDIAKQSQIIDEGQKKVQEWAKKLLTNIVQRTAAVGSIENPGQRKIAQQLAKEGNTKDLIALNGYLHGGDKNLFYRQAAWLATLEFHFSSSPQTSEELIALLERMVTDGYLAKSPTGAGYLRPYTKGYDFPSDCQLEETEKAKIKGLLLSLRGKVFDLEKKNLADKSTLSVKDFLAGRPGKIALVIHAEKAMRAGQTLWRAGGVLLLESDGQRIKPLDATGGIEEGVMEAKNMKVFLLLSSLQRDAPPFIKGLTPEMVKKTQLIWYLTKRGLIRYRFAAMETVNQEGFFVEGKDGYCFLDFKGTWQIPNGATVANFFFLIQRKTVTGVKRIHIASAPNHLEEFFADCLGEYEEGQKFEGVPQPLRAVLQAAYGQAHNNARKSAQIVK